jgi:FkbM family methyltransferase
MIVVGQLLKRIAAKFPESTQQELRRLFFRKQIRRGRFVTDEQEYALLDRFLGRGDWALDIGANVGHYTMRMSELVGADGRVVAFEPVPATFAHLAANAQLFPHLNVSLLNAAASDCTATVGMQIPRFSVGLANYYQAHLTSATGALSILTLPVDALALPTVKLAKIDVEGHELPVLRGMRRLLERDHPVLIVETGSQETTELLEALGYATERLPGSSNILCRQAGKAL